MDQAVRGWRQHIEKIRSECQLSNSDPDVFFDVRIWGAHDLPAALYIRDVVEDLIQSATSVGDETLETVARTDELFRSFTCNDDRGLISRLINEDVSGRGWWWHRIPASGPIADELKDYFG